LLQRAGIASIGPDQAQTHEAMLQLLEDEFGAVAIL
jgi:hypothetical protein